MMPSHVGVGASYPQKPWCSQALAHSWVQYTRHSQTAFSRILRTRSVLKLGFLKEKRWNISKTTNRKWGFFSQKMATDMADRMLEVALNMSTSFQCWEQPYWGFKFFSWISFPQAPEYCTPLGPFRIFTKIRGDIRSSKFTTGLVDTGGKWKKSSSRKLFIIFFTPLGSRVNK